MGIPRAIRSERHDSSRLAVESGKHGAGSSVDLAEYVRGHPVPFARDFNERETVLDLDGGNRLDQPSPRHTHTPPDMGSLAQFPVVTQASCEGKVSVGGGLSRNMAAPFMHGTNADAAAEITPRIFAVGFGKCARYGQIRIRAEHSGSRRYFDRASGFHGAPSTTPAPTPAPVHPAYRLFGMRGVGE